MPERTPYLRGQLEDAQDGRRGGRVRRRAAAADRGDPARRRHLPALHSRSREVVERSRGSAVKVAAQNMHEEDSGAFTGEVSAPMLVELDVEAVVLGHSERRQLFGETDEALARKVPAALAAGLEPILCVGESEEARDAGQTEAVLERQLAGGPRRRSRPPTWPGW